MEYVIYGGSIILIIGIIIYCFVHKDDDDKRPPSRWD